ncbi:glycoside hydrolase family 3 protein [Novosphingobium sp.]|uniref:glycoside hydrolase family 3 protein n=1 Tax=Novosphingobium sp. TaxID=1874826 RepID=UPI0035AE2A0D
MKIRSALVSLIPLIAAACAASTISAPAAPIWSPAEQEAISAWDQRKAGPLDPATEARIASIVAGMTLEQKIGQMTEPDIRYITPDQVREHYIGTILNGGGAWPDMNKHAKVTDWTALAAAYAQAATSTDMKVQIPIVWGIDAVHGNNNVYGATIYPHNIGLGAAHDPALVERIGRATAKSVRATGISWAFAPTVAVVQNQRWGRTYESYSSDPTEVAANGAALIRGLQGNLTGEGDVIASVKHFAGDGGTFNGVDQGENRSTAKDYARLHGAGYYAALDANVQTVMISYNSWTMLDQAGGAATAFGKMHGNKALVTGVLKGRLGFDGLVVSDWNAIEQVPGCTTDHCPQAINAGIDVFMVPEKWQSFIANTVADVQEGRVPMARIDDAVTRILRVKFRMGLFDKPTSASRYTGDAAALADRPLAQEAVRKSAVLLKNDGALPLAPGKRILVVGAAADSFPAQLGGWSMTWQGDETDNADFPVGETMLGGIRRVYGAANVTYSPDGSAFAPGKFDAVIAVVGETPYAEMKGDVRWPAPLAFSPRFPAQSAILAKVSGQGVPVVTLLYSGRTEYATDLLNQSDAFVAAFLPGTEAGALADLLAGSRQLDFSARLSFAWPATACPSGGYPVAEQLFARGYGLSYAMPKRTGRLTEQAIPAMCP